VLVMMPADHIIANLDEFHEAIASGLKSAANGALVTFGIQPDRPETGYGYIAMGESAGGDVRRILKFVEKPDRKTAEGYLESGDYLWNSGIFMMKASVWLKAIREFHPEIASASEEALSLSRQDGDFQRLDKDSFSACPSDSVDYAVMEKITGDTRFETVVVPMRAGWSDVGAWSSLWEVSDHDESGNAIHGDVYALESHDSLIHSQHRMVVALGCDDMIIVETPDAVMVAPKAHSQAVKRVVEWMKAQGREERLSHSRVHRPWGSYEGVDQGDRFQVKRIVVKAGGKLSLQMHHHRAEHWIVVKGTARVTRGEEVFLLSENQSTFIPLGVRHRLENPGTIPLELIEVQSGPYLGEDDIVRFEDVYNRN